MEHNKIKNVLIIAGLILSLFLVVGLASLAGRQGKAGVTVLAAPSTARITVDGDGVRNNTEIFLEPGTHIIKAELDNFKTESQEFEVTGDSSRRVSIMLFPANDAGRKYLTDNPKYQLEREGISGQETGGRAAVAETPLRNILPHSDVLGPFRIDYSTSIQRKNGTVIIVTTKSPKGRAKALDWIRDQGYRLADLEIVFRDFNNPISPPVERGAE